MPAIARIVACYGRAMILEPDGRTFLLAHDDLEPQAWDSGSVEDPRAHLLRFLDSPDNTVDVLDDVGEYPYARLHKSLKYSYDLGVLMNCFSPIHSLGERLEFARISEEKIANDLEFGEFALEVLLIGAPLPEIAVLDGLPETGHVADIVAAVKKKWRP